MIIPTAAKKQLIGALLLTGLLTGLSCIPTERRTSPAYRRPAMQGESLTVFFTGGTLGALKPCGCSGGQLGGFERRPAILNTVPRQKRLLVDTGSLVPSEAEQDLIKYTIILQALRQLSYDVVNLSEKDIEIGTKLGELNGAELGFNLIGAYAGADINLPAIFTKTLSVGGRTIAVTIAALETESESINNVRELFSPQAGTQTLHILIMDRCNPGIIKSVATMAPSVDCIVCPSESDEPIVMSETWEKPMVFSPGRYGRYICKLQATPRGSSQTLKLSLDVIPVSEDLTKDPSLVNLYKDYQQFVKDSNLLDDHIRVALPDNLEYVGSASCKPCHEPEYEKWRSTAHGSAYATLEEVGSQYDPECVVCHVVGLDYESGFISPERTVDLKDVGCENCHGPGSKHVQSGGKVKSAEPKSTCISCHTPEQSGEYAGNEHVYREKIIHWTEPNAVDHVQ